METKTTYKWEPLSLVGAAALSEYTCAPRPSLYKWKRSRPKRVRLFELAAYFDYLTKDERKAILSNFNLELVDLLDKIGLPNVLVKDVALLLGESQRTLNNWWGEAKTEKKVMLLSLLEGQMTILALAKKPILRDVIDITDDELNMSSIAVISSEAINRIALTVINKSFN